MEKIYTTEEAAKYLGVSERTLQNWRGDGKGPKYNKPTDKLVYYFETDLIDWVKNNGNKTGE